MFGMKAGQTVGADVRRRIVLPLAPNASARPLPSAPTAGMRFPGQQAALPSTPVVRASRLHLPSTLVVRASSLHPSA